jgi:hypothetical protein
MSEDEKDLSTKDKIKYGSEYNLYTLIESLHKMNMHLVDYIRVYHQKQVETLSKFNDNNKDENIDLYQAVKDGYDMSHNVITFLNANKKMLHELEKLPGGVRPKESYYSVSEEL